MPTLTLKRAVSVDRETKTTAPHMMTVADVALILQTSERTVRRLIASEVLTAIRIGRLVRIAPSAVAAITDGGKPGKSDARRKRGE